MNSENPYQAPSSDVTPIPVPTSLPKPPFGSNFLLVGGWMSLLLIVLNIPYLAASAVPAIFPTSVTIALAIASMLLSIYLMYVMVRYLEYRHKATDIRVLFYVLAAVGVVFGITSVLDILENSDELTYGVIASIIAMPIYGIPYTMIGFRIKRCAKDSPLLSTLAWLTIASGVSMTTIIFVFFAIPLGIAWSVVFAWLLFDGAREISEAGYA